MGPETGSSEYIAGAVNGVTGYYVYSGPRFPVKSTQIILANYTPPHTITAHAITAHPFIYVLAARD